jgi:hypothetical protein
MQSSPRDVRTVGTDHFHANKKDLLFQLKNPLFIPEKKRHLKVKSSGLKKRRTAYQDVIMMNIKMNTNF